MCSDSSRQRPLLPTCSPFPQTLGPLARDFLLAFRDLINAAMPPQPPVTGAQTGCEDGLASDIREAQTLATKACGFCRTPPGSIARAQGTLSARPFFFFFSDAKFKPAAKHAGLYYFARREPVWASCPPPGSSRKPRMCVRKPRVGQRSGARGQNSNFHTKFA
jgi:hypothetical protein